MPISRTLARELRDDVRVWPSAPVSELRRATDAARPAPAPRRRRTRGPRTLGALVAAAAITLVTAPVAEAISAIVGR